jgi:nicotinamidase-related amidase
MRQPFIVGNVALVVVDIQRGASLDQAETGIAHMPGFDARMTHSEEVVAAARQAGIPVIFIQEVHRRNMVDFARELDGDEGIHCLEGEPATGFFDHLCPQEGEYHIVKRRYSAFFGTELDLLLRGLDVQTVILIGGLTDVCVHYTFVDAHQYGYYARVVEDAVGGSSQSAHDASLCAMEYLQGGARRRAAEVVSALGDVASVEAMSAS